ncbi:MAG: hypothetical protein ACRDFX_10595 [Chloroflexota bacterium]
MAEVRGTERLSTAACACCDLIILDAITAEPAQAEIICAHCAASEDTPPVVAVCEPGAATRMVPRLLHAGALAVAGLDPPAALVQVAARSPAGLDKFGLGPETGGTDVEILLATVGGLHDREIGEELGYGKDYVKHRIEADMHRAGLSNRIQLGLWMGSMGYVLSLRGEKWEPPGMG